MNTQNIGLPENVKLKETIILNGQVGYCSTGDENGQTIGVRSIQRVQRFNGNTVGIVIGGFPFTKEMEDRIGWGNGTYASIQMLTGNTPIDLNHIDETKIVSMMGLVSAKYYHRYSDYTGYLWTEEGFKCGGHDIPKILQSHIGEYIHMEIELYSDR